jgi:hypothetical protein
MEGRGEVKNEGGVLWNVECGLMWCCDIVYCILLSWRTGMRHDLCYFCMYYAGLVVVTSDGDTVTAE